MEKQRQTKVITIVALVVAVFGISLGFAAFSNILTISSSATVKPDASSFSVLFSSSSTSQLTDPVTATGTNNATGEDATISDTTISGLKANFTAPGQSVTYTFYAHNVGSYIAYLRSINFNDGKSCAATSSDTTASLVTAACDDISLSVTVGSTSATANTEVSNHSLAIDAYEQVVVTITYASNGDRADGPFDVTFGDVELEYSSADSDGLISFTIGGTEYKAEAGMTWAEWVASSYNTDSAYMSSGDLCSGTMYVIVTKEGTSVTSTDVIENEGSYYTGPSC